MNVVHSMILVSIGILLGALITSVIETSRTVSYMHKVRNIELECRQLKNRNKQIYDEKCALAAEVVELKQILRANGIPEFPKTKK